MKNIEKPLKRDQMHRCPHCKKLFPDDLCTPDPILGLICPNGCKKEFVQPPYESPLIQPFYDKTTESDTKKM